MEQHSRRQWNRGSSVVSGTCVCVRSGMIRRRFSDDQRRHPIHLWFQLTWIGKEAIRGSRSWHDYRYHVIFAETHLSIEPRRALAIIRSAVRKRVASSFTVRSMALYFLSRHLRLSLSLLLSLCPTLGHDGALNILLSIHF